MADIFNITPVIFKQKRQAIEKVCLELLNLLERTWPDWSCDGEQADVLLDSIKLGAENVANEILSYQAMIEAIKTKKVEGDR